MKCALLGAGTIGFGVIEIADRTDNIKVSKVLDRRMIPEIADRLTDDIENIFADKEMNTVIELLGGVQPAKDWAKRALENGKNVVTANKLMLSESLEELLSAAEKGNSVLRFSAAVGGGIPYLINLLRARRLDRINELGGILNGTTNYILTNMYENSTDFSAALKQAQDLGYAEANPYSDVSGEDVKCKLMLSTCIALNGIIDKKKILCKGITEISGRDIAKIKAMGMNIKLIARMKRTENGVSATVEPTLFDKDSVIANISGVENMAYFVSENAGLQRFTGAGAGRYATAYAVVNDLIDIDNNDKNNRFSIENRAITIYNQSEKRRYLVNEALFENMTDAGEGYYITPEIPVDVMHEKGEGKFFAALSQDAR